MTDSGLDDIDRTILRVLQEDARHNTNAAISDRLDVTASTVSKRPGRLESDGIIRGYYSDIDYERAGYPLVLFIEYQDGMGDAISEEILLRGEYRRPSVQFQTDA